MKRRRVQEFIVRVAGFIVNRNVARSPRVVSEPADRLSTDPSQELYFPVFNL